jgi:hypothetical protein
MNRNISSESDICDKLVRSATQRARCKDPDLTGRECRLRAGRIDVRGRSDRRDAFTLLRADCALLFKSTSPSR